MFFIKQSRKNQNDRKHYIFNKLEAILANNLNVRNKRYK